MTTNLNGDAFSADDEDLKIKIQYILQGSHPRANWDC